MIFRLVKFAYGNARARALLSDFWGLRQLPELAESGDAGQLLQILEQYCPGGDVSLENADALLTENYIRLGGQVAASLPASEGELLRAYIRRVDVENLKVLARGLGYHQDPDRFQPLLHSCHSVGGISLELVQEIESLQDISELLPTGSALQKLFSRLPRDPQAGDLLVLELDLDRVFWEQVAERVRGLSALDRKAAGELLGLRADVERFNLLHRYAGYGLDPEQVRAALPSLGEAYGAGAVREILYASQPRQQLARFFPIHHLEDPLGPAGEVALLRRLHRRLRSVLTKPPFDMSLPVAVVLFKELEKQDLQLLAAGIRVGRKAGQIKNLMITVEK